MLTNARVSRAMTEAPVPTLPALSAVSASLDSRTLKMAPVAMSTSVRTLRQNAVNTTAVKTQRVASCVTVALLVSGRGLDLNACVSTPNLKNSFCQKTKEDKMVPNLYYLSQRKVFLDSDL